MTHDQERERFEKWIDTRNQPLPRYAIDLMWESWQAALQGVEPLLSEAGRSVGTRYKARAYLTDSEFGYDRWVADMYSLGKGTHDAVIIVYGEIPELSKWLKPLPAPPKQGESNE